MNKVTDEELEHIANTYVGKLREIVTELQELRKFAKQRWCSSELMDCNAKTRDLLNLLHRAHRQLSREFPGTMLVKDMEKVLKENNVT